MTLTELRKTLREKYQQRRDDELAVAFVTNYTQIDAALGRLAQIEALQERCLEESRAAEKEAQDAEKIGATKTRSFALGMKAAYVEIAFAIAAIKAAPAPPAQEPERTP